MNPAVTVCVLIVEGISKENFIFTLFIILFQLFGGALAAMVIRLTIIIDGNKLSPNIAKLCPPMVAGMLD